MNKDIEKEIREEWFKDHKANYVEQGVFKLLIWSEPGTCEHAVRYVFDNNKIYITGDIGEAIFEAKEETTLEKVSKLNIQQFHKRIVTINEKWDFNSDKAIAYLEDKIKEIEKETGILYELMNEDYSSFGKEVDNIDTLKSLIESAEECCFAKSWADTILLNHYESLYDYDEEWAEWIFDIGNDYPRNVQEFLIGLKMAYEQLKGDK